MPAPVIYGLITYLQNQLGVEAWDGEVPRQNPDGTDITPDSAVGWPAVNVEMTDQGLERDQTFEDSYDDSGDLAVVCWGTTREQLEGAPLAPGLLTRIEALLNVETNVAAIDMGSSGSDPFYFIALNFRRWTCVQEKEVRAQLSQLLYRGEIHYAAEVHGAVASR